VRGTALLYRDFEPPVEGQDDRSHRPPKRVMMIGGIHGDELTSVSITFKWMRFLDEGGDQPFHWRVVPCANPDGLLTRPSTRVNARGVDLNRNFPTDDWENNALSYWKKRTKSDKRRYPGPRPLSEPETRWLTEQIREFKPDAIVSVHAPFGVLDYDGPREPPDKFGYLRLKLLGTYPGSLGNYAGFNLNVPVITLELPHAGIMPTAQQTEQVWADMLRWLRENLPKPLRPEAAGSLAITKSKLLRESP
jgi:murein peptide amidase A